MFALVSYVTNGGQNLKAKREGSPILPTLDHPVPLGEIPCSVANKNVLKRLLLSKDWLLHGLLFSVLLLQGCTPDLKVRSKAHQMDGKYPSMGVIKDCENITQAKIISARAKVSSELRKMH